MSVANEFLARRQVLTAELTKLEKTIYDLETQYLGAEFSQMGTVLKGLEGFLASKEALKRRPRNFRLEDRLFSLSSKSSPAAAEQQEPEFADPNAYLGRGKGKDPYAAKGIAQKGRR